MLSWRAAIDLSALAKLDLQIGQLLIGEAHCRSIGKSDQIRLQFTEEQFEQIAPADGVDRQPAIFDRPISNVMPLPGR